MHQAPAERLGCNSAAGRAGRRAASAGSDSVTRSDSEGQFLPACLDCPRLAQPCPDKYCPSQVPDYPSQVPDWPCPDKYCPSQVLDGPAPKYSFECRNRDIYIYIYVCMYVCIFAFTATRIRMSSSRGATQSETLQPQAGSQADGRRYISESESLHCPSVRLSVRPSLSLCLARSLARSLALALSFYLSISLSLPPSRPPRPLLPLATPPPQPPALVRHVSLGRVSLRVASSHSYSLRVTLSHSE